IPVVVAATGVGIPFDDWPRNFTTTWAIVPGPQLLAQISYGTTADTCVLLAKIIGARKPFTSTCTPPSVVQTLPVASKVICTPGVGPILVPKMVTPSPGEIDPPT